MDGQATAGYTIDDAGRIALTNIDLVHLRFNEIRFFDDPLLATTDDLTHRLAGAAAGDEEQEHGLAHNARCNGEDAALLRGRQLVVSLPPEARSRFLLRKTGYGMNVKGCDHRECPRRQRNAAGASIPDPQWVEKRFFGMPPRS